eukprot:14262939-Ditylum_brightwellii.AAC.1
MEQKLNLSIQMRKTLEEKVVKMEKDKKDLVKVNRGMRNDVWVEKKVSIGTIQTAHDKATTATVDVKSAIAAQQAEIKAWVG